MPDLSPDLLPVVERAALAVLFGLGMAVLVAGLARHRAHSARARRLSLILAANGVSASQERRGPAARPPLVEQLGRRVRPADLQRLAMLLGAASALAAFSSGNLLWFGLLAVAVVLMAPARAASRRRRELDEQAAATIEMLASGLRAGYSIPQAIGLVAREGPQPTAAEFARTERDLELGSSLSSAMAQLAARTGLADYELVSIIIWMQSQIGGNLASLLDSVVATLRERLELRQKVSALTAQQRMTSMVLSLLPLGVLCVLLLVDRPFVEPLFTQPVGRLLLGIAAVLLFVGWNILRSLSRVEL